MRPEAMGLERAAEAMLRTLGAGRLSLLLPQPATASTQSGLGLSTPLVNEVEMEPVLLQATVSGKSLLAIATHCTVQKALRSAGANSNDDLATKQTLETAMLRAQGIDYRITAVTMKRFGGAELIYELEIEE
jgi:hypothetical protein